MAVVQPPVTGDAQQDSWALQITRLINSGTIGTGVAGTGGSGGGGGTPGTPGVNGFNAATLYLFTRTETDTAPTGVGEDLTYNYESAELRDPINPAPFSDGTNNIWYDFVPTDDQIAGEYIWTTVVYIADQQTSEVIPFSSWSVPAQLSRPGQDAVTVFIEPRSPDNASADWVSLSNTSAASPNFKNDTAKVIGLVVRLYEAGVEVDQSVYTDAGTTYVWTKNGADFTPSETQVTGTGKDMRVLLINEMDVADGNFNEVFTCVIDY